MTDGTGPGVVKLNAVKCLKCNTVAVSTHRHHMQSCECGHVFVDGGHDYKRRGWRGSNVGEFIELDELPVDATKILGLEHDNKEKP